MHGIQETVTIFSSSTVILKSNNNSYENKIHIKEI